MAFHRRIERFSPAAAPRALLAALCVGAMGGLFAAREAVLAALAAAPDEGDDGEDALTTMAPATTSTRLTTQKSASKTVTADRVIATHRRRARPERRELGPERGHRPPQGPVLG